MQLRIPDFTDNPNNFFRAAGYAFQKQEGNEMGFMRRLSEQDYPRFHSYCHLEEKTLIVNLHLDQKKPSYDGTHAHNGEYTGVLIEEEIRRLETFSKKTTPPSATTEKLTPW